MFYNKDKEKMFTIEIGDGREAPFKKPSQIEMEIFMIMKMNKKANDI